MAAGRPARALRQPKRRVIATTDAEGVAGGLELEMTFQTKIGVTRHQHLRVHRAMRFVTGRAAFAHGLVLENKRPALHRVALEAGFVFRGDGSAAADDRRAAMRIVAVHTSDLARFERMAIGQAELPALVQMTIETDAGKSGGVNDILSSAAGLAMDAARAMT